ncbi:nicotinate phosphoribosyltransferase [Eubacteriales bacterium OttesenSCG-928-M02]|nr:nicotinate phosphoribosyltransferase [Eubacteriales bacterium OttesenSCG-928-M02]
MARNLTMLTDLYQLTMMYGYFKENKKEEAVFDLFYRKPTDQISYAVMAGLEQAVEYIQNLHFTDEDIAYLRSLNLFDERFLEMLAGFHFTGDIYAIPEGRVVFPGEPLLRVQAPIMEAQFIETALLTIVNHQTLIATKANRICHAAGGGDVVMEFGLRRAQGPDAGIYGARAAIIGGCMGTSNVLTGELFDVPVKGTHSHSWVMSFPTELDAFRAYANAYPDACLLLVDTYNTLKSGMPNALTVFKELRAQGHEPMGIRLDSGDLAYLSKECRKMLDDQGFHGATITASGDLDETLIADLRQQGARIDVWGVGTKLITSEDAPSLGGVYKMSAMEDETGQLQPKIKLSDNPEKLTNPGHKKVVRIYNKNRHKALADLIMLEGETIDKEKPLTIFDPNAIWKRMTITSFELEELLVPIFIRGELVYQLPSIQEIQLYAEQEMETLWEEYKRPRNPQVYKVDLSQELYDLKVSMVSQYEG